MLLFTNSRFSINTEPTYLYKFNLVIIEHNKNYIIKLTFIYFKIHLHITKTNLKVIIFFTVTTTGN